MTKVKITYSNPQQVQKNGSDTKFSMTVPVQALDTAQDTIKSLGYEIKRQTPASK